MKIDFTDRMQAFRDAAMTRRNRGFTTQPAGRSVTDIWRGIDLDSWQALCLQQHDEWRRSCRDIANQFRVECLNNDDSTQWEILL